MYDDPLRIIAMQDGVFLYREAIAAGFDDNQIGIKRRSGEWHRIRHGCYCFGDVWATLSAAERHLLHARAVLRVTPGPIVFSHVTSLVAHGIAVWGADLGVVHVTRLDHGAARKQPDVRHHVGRCVERDCTVVDGLPVTVPARAVIEAATVLSVESGLVSADSALLKGLCVPDQLHQEFEVLNHWPGSQKIHVVLHHMDARAQSLGETRSRYLFWRQGLPLPQLQYDVSEAGHVFATTDFAWEEYELLGEFDGKEKYLRYLRPGEQPGDAVFREKKREDRIRRVTGWPLVRIVWADLHHPVRTAAQIREMMRRPR